MEIALFILLIYSFGVFVALVFVLLESESNLLLPNYNNIWTSWYFVVKTLKQYINESRR